MPRGEETEGWVPELTVPVTGFSKSECMGDEGWAVDCEGMAVSFVVDQGEFKVLQFKVLQFEMLSEVDEPEYCWPGTL